MFADPGLTTQEICEGDSITPIDFTVSNGATSAILVGAPDGIVITPEGGNVFRVSGSVNENIGTSSIYNFSVTTQGNGCTAAPIPVSIEVNPDQELNLTSSNAVQEICEGESIQDITYALAGGATGVTITGLPNGVTHTVNAGLVTISGTPSDDVDGTTLPFTYTVTSTGSCDPALSLQGTITVKPGHDMSYTGGSLTQEICEGDSITPIDFTVSNGATSAILVGAPDGIVITPEGGNVFRVSGSVNENIGTSSIYNFSVTTQGNGCTAAPIPVSIEVNPDQELNLTSSNAVQEICEGESIQDITYALAGGATGVTITGLPNGVTHTVNAGLVTISGTPSDDVDGTTLPFTYTVTSTGSCDPALSLQGTITVKPGHDMSYTGGSLTQEICEGDSITPIDFTVSNGATSAILVGAPDGIVITPEGGNVFRVSGSVNENITLTTTYNFSVTTQGNGCTAAPIPVSIEVNPSKEIALTSSAIQHHKLYVKAIPLHQSHMLY